MRQTYEAEFARVAGHDERALERIEHANRLGIERMRAQNVFAGEKR